MSEFPFSPSNHRFGINKINRSDVLNCPRSSARSSTAKVFITTTNTITKPGLFIPGRESIKQSVKTETSLVGGKFKIKEWKITKAKGTKFSDTNKCIKITLGCLLKQGVNWGKIVRKGGELIYKCYGINSSKVCDSNIHKRTIKYSNSLADRQQNCTFISFENGGYTQQRTLAHQQVHLELPSQQTNCNVCRVPSQCSKCTCRLGITKCQGQFRLETRCFSFPRDCNTHGITKSGSVCIQTLPPTSSIHCMETRPGQYSNRCIPASLGQGVQFCFSSIQLDKSGSKEDPPRKNRSSNHSDTHMANSALVCSTSKNICTATISSASDKKFANKFTGQKSSSSRNRVTEISSVEDFWESFQMKGTLSNAAKLI